MAYRIACFGLMLGALSACTLTVQSGPQPANGYYAPVPLAAVPVAAGRRRVYAQPAQRPVHVAAHAAVAAPRPPIAAARPPALVRAPGGQLQRPITTPSAAEPPVATQPTAATPPAATPPAASPPAQTSGPLSPPVRRPVGNQKAATRDKTSDSQVK